METREKLRISSSALYTYDDCKEKFRLAYIEKVRPSLGGNIYSVFGTAIHSTIGDFYIGAKFDDPSTITATWPVRFASEMADKKVFISPEKMDEFRELGFDILDKFYMRQKEDGLLVAPKYHETKLVYETENYVVVGIVDIAFNTKDGFNIIDFKTSKKAKTKKEIAIDPQLSMYAFLSWKLHNEIPQKLGLHYLKLDKTVYTSRTLEELQAFGKRLDDLYQTIKTKESWEPNLKSCHWCDFRMQCKFAEAQKIRLV